MADWNAYVRRRLSLPTLRPEREAEVVEDLARQLDEAYREAIAAGATEVDALTRAEQHIPDWDALARQIGASSRQRKAAVDRWQERTDDHAIATRGRLWLGAQMRQDAIHALRILRKSPGITLVVLLSLALGVGANTAIFSVVNALSFRPLPIPHPETLVSISDPQTSGMGSGIESGERTLFSYHEFEGMREGGTQTLSGVLAFSSDVAMLPVTVGDETDGPRTAVTLASGTFFPTLSLAPAMGRIFGTEVDAARMANPVAVVSDAFWRDRLRRDPRAVGRTLRIRKTTFTIVGILQPGFTGLVVGDATDVYVPLTMQEAVIPGADILTQPPGTPRRVMFLHVAGRLKPGVSLEQADAAVNVVFKHNLNAEAALIADAGRRKELLDAHVKLRDARYGLSPLRGQYASPLVILMGLVGLLLLLACANVANLLLARATGRRREFALRVALGASRGRLIRQLLTESLLLAALGAVLGAWVSRLGVQALLRLVSEDATAVPLDAHIDTMVLAFTIGITLITGVLFGLAPALRSTRLDLNVVLRGSAANIAGADGGPGRWPIAKILAGAQVALSLVLLVAAGLFVRSLQNLAAVPLGYEPTHLVMFRLNPTSNGYTPGTIGPLYENVIEKLKTVPGVKNVTLSQNGLFYGSDSGDEVSLPDDQIPLGTDMGGLFDAIGPNYFATVGAPVLAGRDVTAQDGTGVRGCWLGETMRQTLFKEKTPVGHRMVIHYSWGDVPCEIRGVVGDARTNNLRSAIGSRYYTSFFSGDMTRRQSAVFMMRVASAPDAVAAPVRRLLRETDAAFGPPTFNTVAELVDRRLLTDRLTARLSALFGVVALVMAAIGLYGVLSYSVTRRVTEIGVRMALGSGRGRIVRLILGESLLVAGIGAAIGLAAAIGAARLLQTQLFNLSPSDPLTLTIGLVVLMVVAAAATALPAWRASRTDPIIALRSD